MKKLNVTDIAVAPNGDIIFVFENALASLTPEGQIKWVKVVVEPDQGFLRFSNVATSENGILVVDTSLFQRVTMIITLGLGLLTLRGI